MRTDQKQALLIALPLVGVLAGGILAVPAMAKSDPVSKSRLLGGVTGGGSGGPLGSVTGTLGGVTGGSGVLACAVFE